MQYAGFWKRCFSAFLDLIILLPVTFIILWSGSFSKDIQLILIIPHTLLYFAYNIYMNAKYGGTIGKLIVGIRIRRTDGGIIHYKEAFLRNIVDLAFGLILVLMQTYTLIHITDYTYEALSWLDKTAYLFNNLPASYKSIDTAHHIWIWSELLVLLFNKKKRALHDFIAGTVVVDLAKENVSPEPSIDDKLDTILSKIN